MRMIGTLPPQTDPQAPVVSHRRVINEPNLCMVIPGSTAEISTPLFRSFEDYLSRTLTEGNSPHSVGS